MEFYFVEFFIFGLYLFFILKLEYKYANYTFIKPHELHQTDKLYLNIVFVVLAILVMFRENSIGNDSITYFKAYQRYTDVDSDERFELGFSYLIMLSKKLSDYPYMLFITTGAISLFLFYHFIKEYSQWYFMSVIIFVFLSFFEMNMNIMRQMVAIGLTCYSYKYLVSRNIIKFSLTVFIASLFHSSAIIFCFAWFIYRLKITYKNIAFSIFALAVAYFLFDVLLSNLFLGLEKYEGYKNTIWGEGGKIGALFSASIYLILLGFTLSLRRKWKIEKRTDQLDGLFFLCLTGAGLLIISYNMSIVGRMASYFNAFQLILIPNILKILSRRERIYYSIIIVLVLNIFKWTILILRPEWNVVYPYKMHLPF